ncbi:hypothetical protein GIB67_042687 [Kingdonia uniflora]|uniref:DUF7588 domain-containing protein n=1 Tax=Kingdonia uniflora TaxID=39325 RepID=A0A7J7NDF9_9MAGN|nr:hypothetical protein GIB67_042687 [Kingdonia uniflora]
MGSRVMRPSVRRVLGAALPEAFSSRAAFRVSGGAKGGIGGILCGVDAKMNGASRGDSRGSTLDTKMDWGRYPVTSDTVAVVGSDTVAVVGSDTVVVERRAPPFCRVSWPSDMLSFDQVMNYGRGFGAAATWGSRPFSFRLFQLEELGHEFADFKPLDLVRFYLHLKFDYCAMQIDYFWYRVDRMVPQRTGGTSEIHICYRTILDHRWYFLARAGESKYGSLGIINTNPMGRRRWITGISEDGKRQTVRPAFSLKAMGGCKGSCWIWLSITQRAYQAAEIIAVASKISSNHTNVPIWDLRIYAIHPSHMDFSPGSLIHQFIWDEFMTTRNDIFRRWYHQHFTEEKLQLIEDIFITMRLNAVKKSSSFMTGSPHVPEYSFLDARGLGVCEGKQLGYVAEVYASDNISPRNKPPPINDGTPTDSVSDVFVRVTQLMSILETQYSGDTVIIVSSDSDNLTALQAGLVGVLHAGLVGLVGLDLRRHRDLSFSPGEVRFVDAESIPPYKQPASGPYECLNPPSSYVLYESGQVYVQCLGSKPEKWV